MSFATGPGSWNNVTYLLSDFTASSADGPWTLDDADIHAVITRRSGGFVDLRWGTDLVG